MLERLRPLFPYMLRYRRGLIYGGLSVLFTNAIWILFPQVIQRAIDDLSTGVTREKLLLYALALVAVALAKGVFQFLTRWIVIGVSRDIEYDMRNDLFQHLESLAHDYYQRTRTGDIMARTTNDLNAVRQMLGPAIMYSANTLVFTAGALIFMFGISPKLTLVAFLPLPAVSILIQYFGTRIHERFERIQATFSDISARAQENFSGARVIRAYVQEEAEIEHFATANREYIARSLKLVQLMGMLWPTLQTLLGLAVVLVLWLGGREVLAGRISVGQFVAFNTYMVQLTWPIIALGWVINIYQRGTASMARINEILTERATISDENVAPDLKGQEIELRGDIEFRDLTFAFPEGGEASAGATRGNEVLRNINLRIPAGSSLAIVGPTGSGKTTLVSLIPRILDANKGMVLIDGRPIADYPLQALRRNIGYVPQETFLFSDSIRENIAFGTASATDEQIHAAANGASIAADIEGFPEGYKTVVGERGITLSGGQKQRTAIARAIIRDPKILVLDDALSSVDTYTEERILNHLRDVMQGRTTILISHRVSTVRSADKIAVLHDGSIVEYGTHEELIQREGYYTDLYNKQLLEEELAQV
ncbi:MAG: ABC transporter ATP-binding protein [Terriglobales bacterium]